MFKELVSLQYGLSEKLAGPDWLTAVDRVDIGEAIMRELVELTESTGYIPWWSKASSVVDYANCQVEIVDLFHFYMQGLMQEQYSRVEEEVGSLPISQEAADEYIIPAVAELLENTIPDFSQTNDETPADTTEATSNNSRMAAKTFLGALLFMGPEAASPYFWEMCNAYGVDQPTLRTLYLAKNALNQFRGENNYKGNIPGAEPYQKIWHEGNEDNFYVMAYARRLAETGEEVTLETMKAAIAKFYGFYCTGQEESAPVIDTAAE